VLNQGRKRDSIIMSSEPRSRGLVGAESAMQGNVGVVGNKRRNIVEGNVVDESLPSARLIGLGSGPFEGMV
jgi:hypothetical protein